MTLHSFLFIYLFGVWAFYWKFFSLRSLKKWQEMKAIIFLPLHLVNFKHFCVTTWFA